MTGKRVVLLVGLVGVLASQAGHLLAYELRFGAAATSLQSSGAHAYFPGVAKAASGLIALALVAGLFAIGLARVMAGGRMERDSAPAYLRLLAGLFTLQLAFFAVQETAEAAFSRTPSGSAVAVLLWGAAGQLPVAAVAALATRWLLARVRPAIAIITSQVEPAVQPVVLALAPRGGRLAEKAAVAVDPVAFTFTRRGPPF